MIQVVKMQVVEAKVMGKWLHVVCKPALSSTVLPAQGQEMAIWLNGEPQPIVAEAMAVEGERSGTGTGGSGVAGRRKATGNLCMFSLSVMSAGAHTHFF